MAQPQLTSRVGQQHSELTYDVEELRDGFSGHELILESSQDALRRLVDGHVVMAHVLSQRERPPSLCVAGGNFL